MFTCSFQKFTRLFDFISYILKCICVFDCIDIGKRRFHPEIFNFFKLYFNLHYDKTFIIVDDMIDLNLNHKQHKLKQIVNININKKK